MHVCERGPSEGAIPWRAFPVFDRDHVFTMFAAQRFRGYMGASTRPPAIRRVGTQLSPPAGGVRVNYSG
jgi:hypothetical protein